MSVIRAIVQLVASLLVGGSIGYAANRALGVRLGRLEVILVLIALAAYWATALASMVFTSCASDLATARSDSSSRSLISTEAVSFRTSRRSVKAATSVTFP
ncbi:MAG: hypothetical protein EBS89_08985, partial [Proteobacteria bacterium]|nr:hypothetical protein [Pseudomonadota bacterium]